MDKLYIVVRANLEPGLQIAQACHALRQFSSAYPETDKAWFTGSNNIVVLQVPDADALETLCDRAHAAAIEYAPFHEPDLDNEMTAVAIAPPGRFLVGKLPLALRRPRDEEDWYIQNGGKRSSAV